MCGSVKLEMISELTSYCFFSIMLHRCDYVCRSLLQWEVLVDTALCHVWVVLHIDLVSWGGGCGLLPSPEDV